MTLLNITVHAFDVKCGVTVWRDGFEQHIPQFYGNFDIFLKTIKENSYIFENYVILMTNKYLSSK